MSRSGDFKKNLTGEMQYLSFVPNPLPPVPEIVYDKAMTDLMIKANSSIAKLNAISVRLPNVPMFISMYVKKEALLSSQIEGTQATLDDILDPRIDKNINQDISDVINYIKAAEHATKRLDTLPLCNRLLLETHAVLMRNIRGDEKYPGEFRRSQNWIGSQGSSIRTARYIPPNVDDMENAMSDLEKYINEADTANPLVKIALIHYQFETIHPFLDGNGRIGRLMVNLFLHENNILEFPTLYISYFLKKNRLEYYGRLMDTRENGNFEDWIKFFLQALYESAEDAISSIDSLIALFERNFGIVQALDNSRTRAMEKVFIHLQGTPIIDIGQTAKALYISFNTCSAAVQELENAGILHKVSGDKRSRIYSYEGYLQLLRKDT